MAKPPREARTTLAPPAALIESEAAIRDAGEKATHVAKARVDRANREAELGEISKALTALRLAVGIADDAGLEAAAPPPEPREPEQGRPLPA